MDTEIRDVGMSWGKAEPGMWVMVFSDVRGLGCSDQWSVTNTGQHDHVARKEEVPEFPGKIEGGFLLHQYKGYSPTSSLPPQ